MRTEAHSKGIHTQPQQLLEHKEQKFNNWLNAGVQDPGLECRGPTWELCTYSFKSSRWVAI